MSEILKDDFLEFRSNVILSDNYNNGAYNIWLCPPNEEYGYKIFFTHWMGPRNFLEKINIRKRGNKNRQSSTGITTIIDKNQNNPKNLNALFEMLNKLYECDLHPQPIEIFTYKSISGIKIKRAEKCPQNRYDNRKNEVNFKPLDWLIGDNHKNYLIDTNGIHNWGLIDNKIMPIDYDAMEFSHYLTTQASL